MHLFEIYTITTVMSSLQNTCILPIYIYKLPCTEHEHGRLLVYPFVIEPFTSAKSLPKNKLIECLWHHRRRERGRGWGSKGYDFIIRFGNPSSIEGSVTQASGNLSSFLVFCYKKWLKSLAPSRSRNLLFHDRGVMEDSHWFSSCSDSSFRQISVAFWPFWFRGLL